MYPDLSYLLHALIGTSPDNALSIVKTFGLFLILAFLGSAASLRSEFRRKEKAGVLKPVKTTMIIGREASPYEIGSNALLGFLLGFKLPYIFMHFSDFQKDAADVILSAKGTFAWGLVGAILLGYLKYRDGQKQKLPKPETRSMEIWPSQRVGDITIVAAVSGIIGAKLAAPLESAESFRAFMENPLDQLLSGSGLAIYGGLILAAIVVLWYTSKRGIPALQMMDATAPALMVGYGVGRLGCQLSGDGDWGIVNTLDQPAWWFLPDWVWAFDYPHNVLNEGIPIDGCLWQYCHVLPQPVFPTPIYESVMALSIAALLLFLGRRIKTPGLVFFIYVILTGVERFFIEKIRVNPDIEFLGFKATQAEYISVFLMVLGVAGVVWSVMKKKTPG